MDVIRLNLLCQENITSIRADLIEKSIQRSGHISGQNAFPVLGTPDHMVCSLIYTIPRKYDSNHTFNYVTCYGLKSRVHPLSASYKGLFAHDCAKRDSSRDLSRKFPRAISMNLAGSASRRHARQTARAACPQRMAGGEGIDRKRFLINRQNPYKEYLTSISRMNATHPPLTSAEPPLLPCDRSGLPP